MPLGPSVSQNMHELMMDNKKSGKARGANGKPRSHEQMVAIAIHASEEAKHVKPHADTSRLMRGKHKIHKFA